MIRELVRGGRDGDGEACGDDSCEEEDGEDGKKLAYKGIKDRESTASRESSTSEKAGACGWPWATFNIVRADPLHL